MKTYGLYFFNVNSPNEAHFEDIALVSDISEAIEFFTLNLDLLKATKVQENFMAFNWSKGQYLGFPAYEIRELSSN